MDLGEALLMGVANSDSLRKAHEAVQPEIVQFFQSVGQSKEVYDALVQLEENSEKLGLDDVQNRIVSKMIFDMRLSGIGLEGEAKTSFNKIQTEMAQLKTQFNNNVLDSTKDYELIIEDEELLEGIPDRVKQLWMNNAKSGENENESTKKKFKITLDHPSLLPVLQHMRNRDIREQVYKAYVTRSSSLSSGVDGKVGKHDNEEVLRKILKLKHDLAHLLGFRTYAETSIASKMAESVDEVRDMIFMLKDASYDAAGRELEEIQKFANENGFEEEKLALWDVNYWSERLKESKYDFREEELRPYFPLDNVMNGLFTLISRLFGVTIEEQKDFNNTWNEDVKFFHVINNKSNEHIASFYLDPYSRPAQKRGGAWMDDTIGRSRAIGSKPVCYLVCNGPTPTKNEETGEETPSLMSFREVETLFHEMGHGFYI